MFIYVHVPVYIVMLANFSSSCQFVDNKLASKLEKNIWLTLITQTITNVRSSVHICSKTMPLALNTFRFASYLASIFLVSLDVCITNRTLV